MFDGEIELLIFFRSLCNLLTGVCMGSDLGRSWYIGVVAKKFWPALLFSLRVPAGRLLLAGSLAVVWLGSCGCHGVVRVGLLGFFVG